MMKSVNPCLGIAMACGIFAGHASAEVRVSENAAYLTVDNGIVQAQVRKDTGVVEYLNVSMEGRTHQVVSYRAPPVGHRQMLYLAQAYPLLNPTTSYHLSPHRNYVDVVVTYGLDAHGQVLEGVNTITSLHWVILDGVPGVTSYVTYEHRKGMPAATAGSASINFFPDLSYVAFPITEDRGYLDRSMRVEPRALRDLPQLSPAEAAARGSQKETTDYFGLPGVPDDPYFRFWGKYQTMSYEEFYQGHGFVGGPLNTYWFTPTAFKDTLVGGPTKQVLRGVQREFISGHAGGAEWTAASDEEKSRLFGPFYLTFGTEKSNYAAEFQRKKAETEQLVTLLDGLGTLNNTRTYVPLAQRGSVDVRLYRDSARSQTLANSASDPNSTVYILTEPGKNFQQSTGYQYWAYPDAQGRASFQHVRPGTYRLTAFSRGHWGTYVYDGLQVTSGGSTQHSDIFEERSFSKTGPLWQIGTPDRDSLEFQYARFPSGAMVGAPARQYFGWYDYWGGLSAQQGKVVYDVGTHQPGQMPFTHWQSFYPSLVQTPAGNSPDRTGYLDQVKKTAPYVFRHGAPTPPAVAGYTGAPWEIKFNVPDEKTQPGAFVVLSIDLAATITGSYYVKFNESPRWTLWQPSVGRSNPMIRSATAGIQNNGVFVFPRNVLKAGSNTLYLGVPSKDGAVTYDAMKLELTQQPPNSGVLTTRTGRDFDLMIQGQVQYNATLNSAP